MPEILLVSDSHLSPRTPEAQANWDAVVSYVDRHRPDLVVHTGDVTLDGMSHPDELMLGREQLDRLSVPWLAVPGNHDVGDIGGSNDPIDEDRRRRFEDTIGPGYWSHQLGRWRLIGFDSQDLLVGEARGQAIIDRLAAEFTGPYPIAVFQHRPLVSVGDPAGDTPRRYVTEPQRSALQALVARPEVKVVVSGHVHQWRSITVDSTEHVWAPSTWAAMTDEWQPHIGTKVVGIVRLLLDDDVSVTEPGGGAKAELIVPDGIVGHVLGDTLPSPYAR